MRRMDLAGKRVLVTGGGSGLGLALVEVLARRSCRVAACGRRAERLAEAARRVPSLVTAVCDVRRPDDIEALDRRLEETLGGVDVLVSNAGAGDAYGVLDGSWLPQAELEIETDLLAPMRLVSRFLPHLLSRPDAAIVHVTSGLALVPSPATPGYSAAKAGLRAFTRAIRRQLRRTSVRVVEVLPPLVDTEMVAESSEAKMSPEAAADAIVRGLERGRTEIRLGAVRWLPLALRLFPSAVEAALDRRPFPLEDVMTRRPPAAK